MRAREQVLHILKQSILFVSGTLFLSLASVLWGAVHPTQFSDETNSKYFCRGRVPCKFRVINAYRIVFYDPLAFKRAKGELGVVLRTTPPEKKVALDSEIYRICSVESNNAHSDSHSPLQFPLPWSLVARSSTYQKL